MLFTSTALMQFHHLMTYSNGVPFDSVCDENGVVTGFVVRPDLKSELFSDSEEHGGGCRDVEQPV
jgi:hypothetical protein